MTAGPTAPAPGEGTPSGADDERPVCSAKGCRRDAVWLLVWRNPRIHGSAREKTWSACGEHRETLEQFLGVRGFLLRVEPLA